MNPSCICSCFWEFYRNLFSGLFLFINLLFLLYISSTSVSDLTSVNILRGKDGLMHWNSRWFIRSHKLVVSTWVFLIQSYRRPFPVSLHWWCPISPAVNCNDEIRQHALPQRGKVRPTDTFMVTMNKWTLKTKKRYKNQYIMNGKQTLW